MPVNEPGFEDRDLTGNVLITGGAGFLGSQLTEEFLRNGSRVRIFDLAERPDWSMRPGVEYIRGDIRDGAAVGAAVERVDAVIHAAFASPRVDPRVIEEVNVAGARQVSLQARVRGVRRFVLISSTIVQRPPHAHPFLRRAGVSALDMYRKTRAEAEQVLTEQGRKDFHVAIVRPKTFVGAGRISAFTIVFDWIRRGKPVLLLGKAERPYQLLEIRDMAEGIRLLAESDAEGVFHFGADRFGSLREDLQSLIDYAGTGSQLRFVPESLARAILRGMELSGITTPSELHYMSAWGKDSVADTSRAARELGWRPRWSNAEALRNAWDWYLGSIATTGAARSIYPLPGSHRLLNKLIETVLR
ncbi:MAG TPA: NAD-dependent epimerase/dehydratase family protein [Bryobacteraceae bacterium]|nr:NAD-dependent epimerase/dehydratase family protein [Bryobacteraceae bacterium]